MINETTNPILNSVTQPVYKWISSALGEYHCWLTFPLSLLVFFMFPTDSYLIAFSALLIAVACDTLSRIFAEWRKHRKIFNIIISHKMRQGLFGKLFVIGIMAILTGAAYRIDMTHWIGNAFFTFVYVWLFFTEAYSIAENMEDAGFKQFKWFKVFLNKKRKQLLDDCEGDR